MRQIAFRYLACKHLSWGVALLFFQLFLSGIATAQTPFLAATANKSSVAQGEQFQLTYTFNGNGRAFQGPDLKDFNLLGGPSQSTNMQFVNGNFSQSISFTYFLSGKNPGVYKIPPASIDFEGKRIASNEVQMSVTKGSPQQGGSGGTAQRDGSEPVISGKNLFVRAIPGKSTCLKGEGILVTFRLYSNLSVMDFAIPKMPALNGFWNQDIPMPQTLDRSTEVIDGQRYTVWDIKKLVLFPQQSGILTIDPMDVECLVRVKVNNQRSRDPFSIFDDPFFGMGGVRDVKQAFSSAPVKIKVLELPGNPPPGFTSAVGNLRFEASLDRKDTKVNESVTLKLKITGNGNLKLADLPEPELPGDLETYDPKLNESFKAGTGGVFGSKSAEYLIIPRTDGEFEIPAITFSHFDLAKKKYVSQTAGPFRFKVAPDKGQKSTVSIPGGGGRSDVKLIGQDIRYIRISNPEFQTGHGRFFNSLWFYLLTVVPIAAFTGAAIWQKQQRARLGNMTALRIRNAGNAAKKRLSQARKLLQTGKESDFYEEVQRALWGYFSDRFSVPMAELSKDRIQLVFTERGVAEALTEPFIRVLDDCDLARYAGSTAGIDKQVVYNRAEEVIKGIETEIKA
jgi:hypothetical protein